MLKAPALCLPFQRQLNPNDPGWDCCKICLQMCSCPWACPVACFVQAESRSWKEGKLPCYVCLEVSGKSFQQFLMDPRAGICWAELSGCSALEPQPNTALPELLLRTAFGESLQLLLLHVDENGPIRAASCAAACPCWPWDKGE